MCVMLPLKIQHDRVKIFLSFYYFQKIVSVHLLKIQHDKVKAYKLQYYSTTRYV